MKKRLYFLLLVTIFSFFVYFQGSFAFLDEDTGLDLYKDIEKGVDDLETKVYQYNITDGDTKSVSQKINSLYGKDCLKDGLSAQDMIKIAEEGNTELLAKNLAENCTQNDAIQIELISTYMGNVMDLHNYNKANAENEVKNIYKIARIGLYADGNDKNSPFDIIKDLEEINKIIFKPEDKHKYQGTDNVSLSNFYNNSGNSNGGLLSSLFGYNQNESLQSISKSSQSASTPLVNSNPQPVEPSEPINPQAKNENQDEQPTGNPTQQNYNINQNKEEVFTGKLGTTCVDNSTNNIETEYVNQIISTIEKLNTPQEEVQQIEEDNSNQNQNGGTQTNQNNQTNQTPTDNSPSQTPQTPAVPQSNQTTNEEKLKTSDLEGKDVSITPGKCDSFFCIDIEFKNATYGTTNASEKRETIEGLLDDSSKHIKQFANTDLTQKQMGINQWELYWKKLQLKDIFKMEVVVTSKDIPSVNRDKDKEKEKEKDDFSDVGAVKLLEQYYKNEGLEYEKRNSMKYYKSMEQQIKAINNSSNSTVTSVATKYDEHIDERNQDSSQDLVKDLVYRNQKSEDVSYLNGMFEELGSYTSSFEQYTKEVVVQIEKMYKKNRW